MANELLSVSEMYAADKAAMAAGIPGTDLMESAGRAVAEAILARWTSRRAVILCGPGNNGGDGFVVARRLKLAGWAVRVMLLGDRDRLKGDAAWAAGLWDGLVEPATPDGLAEAELVVDALFGAGLCRPLDGIRLEIVRRLGALTVPLVAVDVPSGVNGDDGSVQGGAAAVDLTVTFFRRKPGHLLLPGRALCGETVVADIGIPASVLAEITPTVHDNGPPLWAGRYPWPDLETHKYRRGHALVYGGSVMTGAARLAARAALRAGAGLVTIAAAPEVVPIYALSLPSAIIHPSADPEAFAELLADPRRNAVLLGPGAGVGEPLRRAVSASFAQGKGGVLDADVFPSFVGQEGALFDGLSPRWLLTPHDGEFGKLFPDLRGSRLARAKAAARRTGAAVLLKGADTVIAHPDGRAVINTNAPADLATAGSGDVLAGIALGLVAQGCDGFDAGCMAAWLHGETGRRVGPGLIAEDLPDALPTVLRGLKMESTSATRRQRRAADPE